MPTPFIGEVRMFAGNFAPQGWEFCNGQILSIADNDALFNLIGTIYGGDGQTTFALPNLQSRIPVHQGHSRQGNTYVIGQSGGAETVALTLTQTPVHTHALAASPSSSGRSPNNTVLALAAREVYNAGPPDVSAGAATIGSAGGGQSHDNRQPSLTVSFIIALYGIFPSQN